jgi:hypothetical protein
MVVNPTIGRAKTSARHQIRHLSSRARAWFEPVGLPVRRALGGRWLKSALNQRDVASCLVHNAGGSSRSGVRRLRLSPYRTV